MLRSGDHHRAADLAAHLGVSERTIYRDMDTLVASGLPILGERGVGYRITAEVTLPALNLTFAELEALHLGLNAVGERADSDLSAAARSLSAKLDAVMPEDAHAAPAGFGFATYPFADAAKGFQHLAPLRQALRARQKVRLSLGGTSRVLRPLRLDYWGRLWTCLGWDETLGSFKEVRLDQVTELTLLPQLFVDEPGKRLADYDASQSAGSARSGRK